MDAFATQETCRRLGAKKTFAVAPTNDTKKIAKRRLVLTVCTPITTALAQSMNIEKVSNHTFCT